MGAGGNAATVSTAEHTAVAASLGWSGWGSPVGLGVLIIAAGFFLLCLHWAGFVH